MGLNWRWAFYFVIVSSGIVFLFSIWQIVFGRDDFHLIVLLYGCLFFSMILIFLFSRFSFSSAENLVQTFEKTLKGGLYHFKCPHCHGIFAIKESMYVDKKSVVMTCPDCGRLAKIPPMPPVIRAVIPKKKSGNVRFQCQQCGESLKIWAEGTSIYPQLKIFSCPFCGCEKPLRRF